ncbi:MAG TPA: helix-turn-helix domain-containing protein [Bryobacteraceae bacterium]|nr:helix-turn-helix domain-containing protein [Bryobacteraceae bacterium]
MRSGGDRAAKALLGRVDLGVTFKAPAGSSFAVTQDERGRLLCGDTSLPASLMFVKRGFGRWVGADGRGRPFEEHTVVGYPNLLPGGDRGVRRVEVRQFQVTADADVEIGFAGLEILHGLLHQPVGVALANMLREAACRAGWDPFLAALQERIGPYNIFGAVEHPDPSDARSVVKIELQTRAFTLNGKRVHDWQTLIGYGQVPQGLSLVLDGFLHAQVDLGDVEPGDGRPRLRTISVYRAPALVGEFERPLRAYGQCANSLATATELSMAAAIRRETGAETPIPAAAQIEVIPREVEGDRLVHLLFLSYEELDSLCRRYPVIDVALQAHVRHQVVNWLPLLGLGRNVEKRVVRWLLEEHAALSGAAITMPVNVFQFGMRAGVNARAADGGKQTSREDGRKALTKLHQAGLIELRWEDRDRDFTVEIKDIDGLRRCWTRATPAWSEVAVR